MYKIKELLYKYFNIGKCIHCNKLKFVPHAGICEKCYQEVLNFESMEPQTQEEYDFIMDHLLT